MYFFFWGNEKFPIFSGIGKVNFYMCQFPFDLDRVESFESWTKLASFDYVLVNSRYTRKYYMQYLVPYIPEFISLNKLLPKIEVVYPPRNELNIDIFSKNKQHIALLGRIFEGRQNKGHLLALQKFKELSNFSDFPVTTELFIAGQIQPGHEKYAEFLQLYAKKHEIRVKFVFSADSTEIKRVLKEAKVFWHLTGIDTLETDDPASTEHFGISIVEAMTEGCIPIATNRGGPIDIITNNTNGFLANTLNDYVSFTRLIFEMSDDDIQHMKSNAINKAETFSNLAFAKRVSFLVQRGFANSPFRIFLEKNYAEMSKVGLKLSLTPKHTAVIVEPGFNSGFEFCVKNVLKHLGESWSLHVFHSAENDSFVKTSIASIEGVKYSVLSSIVEVNDYNQLLKTKEFWNGIQGEKILIFQSDSLMLTTNITSFTKFDYIGAPWHLQNERWELIQSLGLVDGVGNGGFSLRSRRAMIEISSKFGPNSPVSEQEDVFFASYAKKLGYRVADRASAYSFCHEVPCTDLKFDGFPMAIHAAWYYFDKNTIESYFAKSLMI